MALNATIHKVELSVSDMDRHYYETHKLTVAKHPSETDERMMLRVLAFALMAHDQLEMTRGLSTDEEPDIWRKSLSGELELSVLLGLPSEKVIRQTCNKSAQVLICAYGGRAAEIWWEKTRSGTTRFDNLRVLSFAEADTAELARHISRSMRIQVNIQDGDLMISFDDATLYVTPAIWQQSDLVAA
ncbi:YaeQ family protein [Falsigemmobacter intermedius]|uniref:YaeQ family protein n=1 Tax=Falsigemmobacter intermedius TaxID=1553448 RepID=UPI003EFDDD33